MQKPEFLGSVKERLINNEDTIVDEERVKIREELSTMTFEELQKLKEEMGSKLYNEAVFGKKKLKKRPQTDFKRENKNRPRELPAKKQVPLLRDVTKTKIHEHRDPRFDARIGEFNEKAFRASYRFIKEVKLQELESLKVELKETQDPEHIEKLKYLISRIENQNREERKIEEKKQKEIAERLERAQQLKEGKKPIYRKKSEKRFLDLVEQYEHLKQTGGLQKHITKRGKKNAQRDRKIIKH